MILYQQKLLCNPLGAEIPTSLWTLNSCDQSCQYIVLYHCKLLMLQLPTAVTIKIWMHSRQNCKCVSAIWMKHAEEKNIIQSYHSLVLNASIVFFFDCMHLVHPHTCFCPYVLVVEFWWCGWVFYICHLMADTTHEGFPSGSGAWRSGYTLWQFLPYKHKSLSLSEWWSYTIGCGGVGVSSLGVALSKWIGGNVSYIPTYTMSTGAALQSYH